MIPYTPRNTDFAASCDLDLRRRGSSTLADIIPSEGFVVNFRLHLQLETTLQTARGKFSLTIHGFVCLLLRNLRQQQQQQQHEHLHSSWTA